MCIVIFFFFLYGDFLFLWNFLNYILKTFWRDFTLCPEQYSAFKRGFVRFVQGLNPFEQPTYDFLSGNFLKGHEFTVFKMQETTEAAF